MVIDSTPRTTAPTVADVARIAGVSTATVSRVVNASGVVAEPTRSRVQHAIATLGYRPNAAARMLAGASTETLGLIIPELSSPYYFELLSGIEHVARETGHHLLIAATEADRSGDYALPPLDGLVDGMIVTPDAMAPSLFRTIIERRRPLVLVERHMTGVPSVAFANREGAASGIGHLLEVHGARRVAILAGPEDSDASREREAGWRDALMAAGLPCGDDLVVRGAWSEADGDAAVRELIARQVPLDALVCANDEMAIGAIRALTSAGRSVPGDVRVVGFDDIGPAGWVRPALTTVGASPRELGIAAARILIQAVHGPVDRVEARLPTTLVIRASCGCSPREE